MYRKAVFFDRDGIVNKRIVGGYVTSSDKFEFIPEFIPLFKLMSRLDYCLVVVTNQQGIGKGMMSESDLFVIHKYMQEFLLSQTGKNFDALYFCGSLEKDKSYRRKPNPGMLLEAIDDLQIDASQSYMIGDSISDVEAGKRVGCTTILVGDFIKDKVPEADYIFDTLSACTNYLEQYLRTTV